MGVKKVKQMKIIRQLLTLEKNKSKKNERKNNMHFNVLTVNNFYIGIIT